MNSDDRTIDPFLGLEHRLGAVTTSPGRIVQAQLAERRRIVVDRGRGGAGPTAAGSGIVGRRDRVESIGGRLHHDRHPTGGTILRAEPPAQGRGSSRSLHRNL